jgi:hypothetical protein
MIAACAAQPVAARAPVEAKERERAVAVPMIDFEVPWPSASPEDVGLARPALEKLIAESQKTDTDALLVLSGDRVVVARAFGHAPSAIDTKSVTKGLGDFPTLVRSALAR